MQPFRSWPIGLYLFFWLPEALSANFDNQQFMSTVAEQATNDLVFSSEWRSLGPFKIGTREAVWGADPIEAIGGFKNLKYNASDKFHSSLATNATVSWDINHFMTKSAQGVASVDISLVYDEIDWWFLRSIYGWAAFQYQSWTRGELVNHDSATRKVMVYATNILEMWLNDEHYFGVDFYGFSRAPIIVDLVPGRNILNVRLVRDVRAMGGTGMPTVAAQITVQLVGEDLATIQSSLVLPDVINGQFASAYGSITVCNTASSSISIIGLHPEGQSSIDLLSDSVQLAPGQARPVVFQVDHLSAQKDSHTMVFQFQTADSEAVKVHTFEVNIIHRSLHDPHKFTFLHSSGTVSYAILRPPPTHLEIRKGDELPLLVALHGAGLEADSHQVRHAFDEASDLQAWLLFPTGMSPWCGDDWHTWGFADIQAAMHAIPQWVLYNKWPGSGVQLKKYIIAGHSNGGQGTWFTALHQPDQILAAAPVSAYSSIENYVPFVLWNEGDPLQNAIVSSAKGMYRHELFLENIKHIPVLVQHGECDDNVPAYHSRLMSSLAFYVGVFLEYVELPRKLHWFEGAMTTSPLLNFYHRYVDSPITPGIIPDRFSFVVGNSGDFGSRFGIEIQQLRTPDRLAKIQVDVSTTLNATLWSISSTNVHRLRLSISEMAESKPDAIQLEDNNAPKPIDGATSDISFVRDQQGNWQIEAEDWWQDISHRSGRQRGAMDAILRTSGHFQILYCCPTSYKIALQVSRNLLQYFGADSQVRPLKDYDDALNKQSNVIVVALKQNVPTSKLAGFPIFLESEELNLRKANGMTERIRMSAKIGGSWLRPLPGQRLELVLWGWDIDGLQQAARMAPTLTGAGQPDFVIFGTEAGWKGHAGTLAMGYFDYAWNISMGSFLP